MRLFETNKTEAIDSPIPRNNEANMPHCKIYNRMMELIRRILPKVALTTDKSTGLKSIGDILY